MKSFTVIDNGCVTTPAGFKASGVVAGLKRSGAPDMAMIYSDAPATVAGAFTANRFAAASVVYDRELIARRQTVRAVLVNSGNANACTGARGAADVRATVARTAELLGLAPDDILVSSTGRIGVPMPMQKILAGAAAAVAALAPDGGVAAARAIMTTDTRPKHIAVSLPLGGRTVHIGGMAKGAGMIAPNLKPVGRHATMLAYLTTDAALPQALLQDCLDKALDASFNRVTVDGDTSTNDTFIALANGAAGNPPIAPGSAEAAAFAAAFTHVAAHLAREMVMDGEGATRFVELRVTGAVSDAQARTCAMAIANSLLCKTAWFGADPNWGRILDAAGYSGVELDPAKVTLDYEGLPVVRQGMDAGTPEAELAKAINQREFAIDLDLGVGTGRFTAWTCDISYEYVKINADYHT